jgi:single-strand DNA-binding protein
VANEVTIVVEGRLTADPEIRFVNSGSAVCSFTVAHNSRKFDKNKNEWVDSEATFYNCSLWGTEGENVAETLRKGMSVIVHGVQGTRSWDHNGEKKSRMEVRVLDIGLSLRFVRVNPENIIKSTPKSAGGSGFDGSTSAPKGGSDDDPWATPAPAGTPDF